MEAVILFAVVEFLADAAADENALVGGVNRQVVIVEKLVQIGTQ